MDKVYIQRLLPPTPPQSALCKKNGRLSRFAKQPPNGRHDLDRLAAFLLPFQTGGVALDKASTVRISARACRLQGGTRRPAANCARFAAPAATTNRRNSGWTAAPWVHKNRPAIRERNDSLI